MLENRLSINIDKANIVYETINYSIMKPLVITLFISMLPSLLTISYAGDSGGKGSSVPSTGTNSLALDEQWSQFIQLVDNKDYGGLENFLENLEDKQSFLESQYTEEDEEVTYTPLHYASMKSVPSMIELLISQGANVNAIATNQATPLHYAVAARRENAVQCLLLANASLKSGDEKKFTPLSVAILRAYRAHQRYQAYRAYQEYQKYLDLVKCIKCIIEYRIQHHEYRQEENKAILAAQDNLDNTPVHYAFSSGDEAIATQIVALLTRLDPSDIEHIMQMKNKDGKTPQEAIQNQSSLSALQKKINQKILK